MSVSTKEGWNDSKSIFNNATMQKAINADKGWNNKQQLFEGTVAEGTVLWNGNKAFSPIYSTGHYMAPINSVITLSQPISKLNKGLVINFDGYVSMSSSGRYFAGQTATKQVPKDWSRDVHVITGNKLWSNYTVSVRKIDDTHIMFISTGNDGLGNSYDINWHNYSTQIGWTNVNNGDDVQYAVCKSIVAY